MDFDSDDAGCLKSDGTNYLLWSYMIRNFEMEGELWDHVSGSVTRPHPKDKNYANLLKQWESMNATALSIIEMYVDHSLRKRLAKYNSARSAWDYLARLYAHDDESNFAKKYRLEMEIQAVKQSGFPITGLYCLMQCYWQQLAEMEPKELSDLESYKKYREESRLLQLLIALPDKFEPTRKHMLQRSTLPSVSEAVRELLVVEHGLIYPQLSSLSLEDSDKSKTGRDECLYCYGTGCQKLDCSSRKKNDKTKRTGGSCKDSHQSGGCQPSIYKPMQCPDKNSQPSSSSSKSASSLTPDTIDQYRYIINMMNQVESDLFGRSPLESGMYLPSSRKGLSCFQSLSISSLIHHFI